MSRRSLIGVCVVVLGILLSGLYVKLAQRAVRATQQRDVSLVVDGVLSASTAPDPTLLLNSAVSSVASPAPSVASVTHPLVATVPIEPAVLAPFEKAKRRRKYSSNELPNMTLAAGFGDACFAGWPPKASSPHPNAAEEPTADCLPDPNATYHARCIASRRDAVLRMLDSKNWTIEVWFMAGRWGYLNITSHYLKPMLRQFGGVAARVVWLHESQQDYIPKFAKAHYGDLVADGSFQVVERGNIRRMYRRSLDTPSVLVLKFDDDTAFIQPHAVTAVFERLLDPTSNCIVVSGNVVNHVGLNPVHALIGALNVSNASGVSPRSVAAHRMSYDGFQRNVLGSYQEPVEWRQAHVDMLRAIRDDRLHRFYFPASHRSARRGAATCSAENGAGGVFDFQCDGMVRRWGINFIAFPALGSGHFSAMRDLGHRVKNKDEVYFTMDMGRHTAGNRTHTCAVADAITVHFLNTGQASNVRATLGLDTKGKGSDPRVKDASLLAPGLLAVYKAVAEHFGGVKKCCRSTQCPLFDAQWERDPNVFLKLP